MPNPADEGSPQPDKWVASVVVVAVGLLTLLVLANMALANLVTAGPPATGGKVGASDAIALISASGAIISGIIGAYFGVNIASKSANTAQSTQVQANRANRTAVAAAAALDPESETAKELVRNLGR